MAMSDADIRREVRELLSRSTKVHGKTASSWGTMGLAAGVAVGAIVTVAINRFIELPTWGDWILFLILAFAIFRVLFSAGERINTRRAEKLAERFYGIFPKDSEDFDKAIVLVKKAKTDSGVEKALLAALKMDVTFTDGGKKSGFLETGEFGFQLGGKKGASPIPTKVEQMMADFAGGNFATSESGPGWSKTVQSSSWTARKVPKAMFDKLLQSGKLELLSTPGDSSGVGVLGSGLVTYYGNIDIMAALKSGKYAGGPLNSGPEPPGDPADQLLGGFDEPGEKPPPSSAPVADRPAANPGFIPLDPYSDKDRG